MSFRKSPQSTTLVLNQPISIWMEQQMKGFNHHFLSTITRIAWIALLSLLNNYDKTFQFAPDTLYIVHSPGHGNWLGRSNIQWNTESAALR